MVERPFPPPVSARRIRERRQESMDDATKITLGIVVSAVLVLVVTIGYHEFERQRDIREAQEVMQGVLASAQQGMAQAQVESRRYQEQQAAQLRYQQQRQVYEDSRYLLADDQQCVGGAVVQVHGNEYTQIGGLTQPVHCSGRRADRPLR